MRRGVADETARTLDVGSPHRVCMALTREHACEPFLASPTVPLSVGSGALPVVGITDECETLHRLGFCDSRSRATASSPSAVNQRSGSPHRASCPVESLSGDGTAFCLNAVQLPTDSRRVRRGFARSEMLCRETRTIYCAKGEFTRGNTSPARLR